MQTHMMRYVIVRSKCKYKAM